MDVTITIPDRLKPALQAAAAARGDKNAQAFMATAVKDALSAYAQKAVQLQKQEEYKVALAEAQQQVQDDLDAIGAK